MKRYKIEGIDCANCAAKIEDKIKKIDGVKSANLSFISERLKLDLEDGAELDPILDQVEKAVATIEPDARLLR